MVALRKFIALILALLQSLFVSLGIVKPESFVSDISVLGKELKSVSVANKSETNLADSIEYAQSLCSGVQCAYGDSARSSYIMTNGSAVLKHQLSGVEKYAALSDKNGNVYIGDSFKSFYFDNFGKKQYFETSYTDATVNTIRLGQYYYDCHIRDMDSGNYYIDKGFHVYSDKLYMEYAILADSAVSSFNGFGSEIEIPESTVSAIQIKDKNGIHSGTDGIDAASVEYAAFDIKGAGIAAFIIPADGSTEALSVTLRGGKYTVTQTAASGKGKGLNKYDETGGYDDYKFSFGCRIYTDGTHSFDGAAKEAYYERNPLRVAVLGGNSHPVDLGYDALRGAYTFKMDSTSFGIYYVDPDMKYDIKIRVYGGEEDRDIFIRTTSESGCLECAAVLDENDVLMPIQVETCKNFRGDGGEPVYSFTDYAYGDTFFPLRIKKDTPTDFTVLNLYQNWGKYPLKQLSSIEFHVSYYHLSTGCTESNCIAPYFVFEKDGWTLPDFRCRSGVIWETQPQFNSVGILKFMSYRDKAVKNTVYSEFRGSEIASRGMEYADVTDYYTADSGVYDYSVRHVEFPQTDENRTYYTLKVDFKENVTFDNFKKDFDIFYFDGRFVDFEKIGYLSESGECVQAPVSGKTEYHTLGSRNPYFGFYKVTEDTADQLGKCFGCNFALIIKDSSIVSGGEKKNIPFVFREGVDAENTGGCLTLDAEKLSFAPGDSIEIQMILLPWGDGTEADDSTVLSVRDDSCINPIVLTTEKGTVVSDAILPEIKAENGEAQFTLKGGKGNIAVRVDGFSSVLPPVIETLSGGEWIKYDVSSSSGYDGYTVHSNPDGSYSFSFVYTSEGAGGEYTFRVSQGAEL